ncbi:helix-turn-helix domain-containing protein [Rhodococcus fascians]|nr:helix-turn-helix domain-containing protein [Rhodococcus fascians]
MDGETRWTAGGRDAVFRAAQKDANPRSVVAALSERLPCDVLLFDPAGDMLARSVVTEASAGAPVIRDLKEQLSSHSFGGPSELAIESNRVIVRPLRTAGSIANVLVAVSRPNELTDDDTDLIEFGATLMELLLSADSAATRARERNRSDLLGLILADKANDSHTGWLIAHGFAAGNDLQGLVVTQPDRLTSETPVASCPDVQSLRILENHLDSAGVIYLSKQVGPFFIVLTSVIPDVRDNLHGFEVDSESLRDLAALAESIGVSVGVSTSMRGLSAVSALMNQAVLAARWAMANNAAAQSYSTLPSLFRFVDRLPPTSIEQLAHRVAPLKSASASDERLRTLWTLLECDGSVARAASALYLHPNSLRKRLRSIENALEIDVTSTDGVVEARLSLIADRILDARALLPEQSIDIPLAE